MRSATTTVHTALPAVEEPDRTAAALARQRLDALAKPPGSLGRLEELVVQLAAIQRTERPRAERARVLVFAGDHGVARAEAVSPYPPEVTRLMVETFARGQAAVSALSRCAGSDTEVIDCGVLGLPAEIPVAAGVRLWRQPVARRVTGNLADEPAMSAAELAAALEAGRSAARRAADDGIEVVAVGEMGIGNSTAAAALAARLLGRPAHELCGPGTGLDTAGVARKAAVVERALARCALAPDDAAGALAELGGFELAAMAGCFIEAAHRGLAVLLDGFIASAAALAAVRLRPALRAYLVPATLSPEPGHRHLLDALAIGAPIFQLGLRLGEASGAALALPVVRAACRLVHEMATLESVLTGAGGGPAA
jgi:nicotinate-nucleotide--dimethylbenzimidazole phosphoribosyltransferase